MTDANTPDPFKTEEQINPLDYVKTKFAAENGEVDLEKLARGKYESDKHIATLEAELAELRKKAEQGMAVKDLLEAIKSNRLDGGEPPPASREEGDPAAKKQDNVNIEDVVQSALAKAELERREAANKQEVVNKLNEVWGNNVSTELQNASRNLGISVADLEKMGKQSPQALFRLLGVDAPKSPPPGTTVPRSSVNLPTREAGVRNFAYYNELRKSNPKLYYDPKTQAQEMRDAIALGEAFFS